MVNLVVRKILEGKVRSCIDGTICRDTLDEYVSQAVEQLLVLERKYLKEPTSVEFPIRRGNSRKCLDVVVFSKHFTEAERGESQHVQLAIECKKDSLMPSAHSGGLEQLKTYYGNLQSAAGGWVGGTNGRHKTDGRLRCVGLPDGLPFGKCSEVSYVLCGEEG